MKTLTTDFFRQFGPCYDPAEVLGENWSGTILDLLNKEGISDNDRIWAATRPGVLDDKTMRIFAVECVEKTPIGDGRVVYDLLTDERSRNALTVARRYASGAVTYDELAAAVTAAGAAAVTAAGAAAWAAARAAAVTAAGAAAWAAARAVAGAVAWAAAWAFQVQLLINLITEK